MREEERNILRFLWFRANDLTKEVIEYRVKVHVFGNGPSPAVTIYCLRQSEADINPDVCLFVEWDFMSMMALNHWQQLRLPSVCSKEYNTMQCSLGLNWDLKKDTFTFKVTNEEKPFTLFV